MKSIRIIVLLLSLFIAVSFASPSFAEFVEIRIGVSLDFASDIVRDMEQHPNACAEDDFLCRLAPHCFRVFYCVPRHSDRWA